MNREELSPKALEMMKAHSLNEVYLTSDGQGFTEKHRAEAQASLLKNKQIEHFVKSKEAVAKIEPEDTDEDTQEDERTTLVAKYEQLFNKKPAHNIGVEKLKTQIAEKEAELLDVPVIVQGTTTTTAPVENPTEEKTDLKQD